MIKRLFVLSAMLFAAVAYSQAQPEAQPAKAAPEAQPAKVAPEAQPAKAAPEVKAEAKPANQEPKAEYKAPALSDKDSWTMVVVPDVQAYVERPRNHGIVDIMNAWIADNVRELRIQQVLFTGDLVYRNDQDRPHPDKYSLLGAEQWRAFSRLMERLDGRVPYILCTGNHDYGQPRLRPHDIRKPQFILQ